MLNEYFLLHLTEFETIARILTSLGAYSVRLMEGDKFLAAYPEEGEEKYPCTVVSHNPTRLQMYVYGLAEEQWHSTAESLLDLFASLMSSEAEMEGLTVGLIEMQDRLVAMLELTEAARRTLGITDLLDLLCSEACRLLDAKIAFTLLQVGVQPTVTRVVEGAAVSQEEIIQIASRYKKDTSFQLDKENVKLPRGLSNLIMVSLPEREGLFVLLGVANKNDGIFSAPDIKLAQAICDQIGAQLENALLYEEGLARTRLETEMDLAHHIQSNLIPQQFPSTPGVELFGASRPAFLVGGDFMDVISIPNHPMAFFLGDIAGKGMSAALLMTMARTVAHSALINMPYSRPDEVMRRLNTDLQDDFSRLGVFTTAFIGVWDNKTRILSFTNAGQSPIIYAPVGREPQLLEAVDIPVGIVEKYPYSTQSISLNKGDVFLIASDGLPEAQELNKNMFGYDRVKSTLGQLRGLTAREICDGLLNEISLFSGNTPQADDQTLLVIKVT